MDGTSAEVVVAALESVEALRRRGDDWDDFVAEVGSDLYFTVDWLRTWWEHYGAGQTLLCLLIYAGGTPIAALPFCHRKVWLGLARPRVACLVGAQQTNPVFRPAIRAGYEDAALAAATAHLFAAGCEAVSFSPLAGDAPLVEAARRLDAEGADMEIAADARIGVYTKVVAPETFDGYLAMIDRDERSRYRRNDKRLAKTYATERVVVRGQEALPAFDRFVEIHRKQWEAAGALSHFGDWPKSEAYNRDLVERLIPKGQVEFHEIRCDGEVLSSQFCFVFGDLCHWRLPARAVGGEMEKLGLGRIGFVKMIEGLIEGGVRVMEAGQGHYRYKLRLAAEENELRRLILCRRSFGARLRAKLLARVSDLLNLVYYRGWYIKIAPKLGVTRRPLWSVWSRTRY